MPFGERMRARVGVVHVGVTAAAACVATGCLSVVSTAPAAASVVQLTLPVTVGAPLSIAVDPSGDLLVLDGSNGHVVELSPGPSGSLSDGTQSTLPLNVDAAALATDRAGDLFVASPAALLELTPAADGTLAGGTVRQLPSIAVQPEGLAVDSNGDLFASDIGTNQGVAELTSGSPGPPTFLPFSNLDLPVGVAVDDTTGDVFVAGRNSGDVLELSPGKDGKLDPNTQTALPFSLRLEPDQLALDGSGDLLVSDFGTGQIEEMTPGPDGLLDDGAPSTVPFTGLTSARGVAVDASGDVFASDLDSGQVLERVDVGPVSAAHSTLTVAPTTVAADGTSSMTVTVQARDGRGNPEPSGSDAVVVKTTRGTASTVTDHGDGTYTATLTSTQAGLAFVTATLDGAAIGGSATVTFSAVAPGTGTPGTGTPGTGTPGTGEPPTTGPLAPAPGPTPTSPPEPRSVPKTLAPRLSKVRVTPHAVGVCSGCTYPKAQVRFTLSRATTVRLVVQARRHGHWRTVRTIAIKAHAGASRHALKGHWAGALTVGVHLRLLVQLSHGRGWSTQKTVTLKTHSRRHTGGPTGSP
jgi:hypothetical protein